jgi:hypothetical protein
VSAYRRVGVSALSYADTLPSDSICKHLHSHSHFTLSMRRLGVVLVGVLHLSVSFAYAETPGHDKYTVLARALQPFCALFRSKTPTKAMQAEVVLEDGAAATAALLNQPVYISFQVPDKLRIETLDHRLVFCRIGQRVWVHPNELATKIVSATDQPRSQKKLADFHLPLKDQQLVLLPALFQILRFEPEIDSDGTHAWAMELRPAPAITEATKSENWSARAVIKQEGFQVRQVKVQSRKWNGTVNILSNRFVDELPAETWEADPEIAEDMGEIPPGLFDAALEKLMSISLE